MDILFFSFYDNASLTDKEIEKKKLSAPKGTKLYKNKILGLRGRATGLIFSNFERKNNVISREKVKGMKFVQFTAGLDTSYSQESSDTFAFTFMGTTDKKELVLLDEEVYSNKDLSVPLAPSDIAPKFFKLLEKNRADWGFARDVFVDSADQVTIMELKKYKRQNPSLYNIINSYKKFEIIDRIHTMQDGLIPMERFITMLLMHVKSI